MDERRPLTYDMLRQTARDAYQESGITQVELAQALDVSQSSISQALATAGPKFAHLQRRIIEHLTPYKVTEEVRFYLHRPDA